MERKSRFCGREGTQGYGESGLVEWDYEGGKKLSTFEQNLSFQLTIQALKWQGYFSPGGVK